jgi:hypothetical protein
MFSAMISVGVLHVERYRSEVMDFLGRRLSERLIL